MTKKWLIDTDILVDYLRGLQPAVKFIEKQASRDCYLSVITIAELYAGVREGKECQILEQFLALFEVVELNIEIAEKGGLYRRDYGKSHGIGLADALIAASSQSMDAILATLNKKHYPMLTHVHVPYVKN